MIDDFLLRDILNYCDVKWLPFCYKTKALCLTTKGQPRHVTIIQDGGARKFENKNTRF